MSEFPVSVDIARLKESDGKEVTLRGWLYNKRGSKSLQFLILRDGSGLAQCIISQETVDEASWMAAEECTRESALEISGTVRRDDRQVGGYELQATSVTMLHKAEEYPITPKEHGVDFLMNHRHLWLGSRRQWAILESETGSLCRSTKFFRSEDLSRPMLQFLLAMLLKEPLRYLRSITSGDSAYLTQSGQLHGEAMAMAFGKIYTFGPTFRAEKSKTRRHLTEFWMIEPEMAFYDLDMNMSLAEELIVRLVGDALRDCMPELEILERDVAPLRAIQKPFPRITYDKAVELLHSPDTARMFDSRAEGLGVEEAALREELVVNRKAYGQAKKGEKRRIDAREIQINKRLGEIEEDQRNLPKWRESAGSFEWGSDFGGSDETVLTWHFDGPIIVHRFPHEFKAFYMKRDPDDDRLALGMDVLAPEGYGEVIGGGERATDLSFLQEQVKLHNLPVDALQWYFDLRRYGSVPHSGFGLGLERAVTWICGIHHLRESIPFARTLDRLYP